MRIHPLVWLLPATVFAYLNAISAGFQFDDFNVIVDNPAVHSLAAWWESMPGIRPLLKLSYTLNWLADPGPAGFHAVNVLLHLVNVALVWHLTEYLPQPLAWEDESRRIRARIVTTLLFALHPIQTESVTYICGRSMSLMATFGIGGLLAWLQAPRRGRPCLWRGVALLLLAAAILTKEVAVILPLTLLLFGRERRIWLPVMLAVAALVILFTVIGYQHFLDEAPIRSLGANLLSELNAVYYLIGQLLRPHALNIDPVLPELTAWSPGLLLQASGLAGLLLIAGLGYRRWPWLAFGVFWFVILLLPTHTLIARLDLASERHLYLASLGIYWLVGIALATVPDRRIWLAVLVALALAGLAFTHQRNIDYQDEISLWHQTTALSPDNSRAWNNLGWAFFLAKRNAEAKAAFRQALQVDPGYEEAQQNLDYLEQASP